MRRTLVSLGASLTLAACADPVAPPDVTPSLSLTPAQSAFARYVAMGTSNSMAVQSAGVVGSTQRAAWTAQLAARIGAPFVVPAIQSPGCGPPLLPPLAADLVLVGAFGDDLVTAVMNTCAPLESGITLPANSVAISGAKAWDALYSTIETEALGNLRSAALYSRVLLPRQTQVQAMLSQRPTFVSVELAANEVLPASTGRVSAMTPFNDWKAVYDQIIGAVKSTGARAVLVGLPNDARNFPSIRRAREFWYEWPYLLTLGIRVSTNCYYSWLSSSQNYLFIPGYLLTLISRAPTTASCADVPGAVDYVLTPSDISAINARMAQMNAHIQTRANENGYAYFSLSSLYDLPKGGFSVPNVLFSDTPFGPYISLDGVHPSAAGQTILATAAAKAINARYGLGIPEY